jgi:hypothetical protein
VIQASGALDSCLWFTNTSTTRTAGHRETLPNRLDQKPPSAWSGVSLSELDAEGTATKFRVGHKPARAAMTDPVAEIGSMVRRDQRDGRRLEFGGEEPGHRQPR